MARFFQQTSWLGIEFSSLPLELNPLKLADSVFYDVFYERLMQTYPNYSDFPSDWRDQKAVMPSFFLGSFPKIPTCYLLGAVLDTWNLA